MKTNITDEPEPRDLGVPHAPLVDAEEPGGPAGRQPLHWFAFSRIGVVYVWIGIIILFSILAPSTFPTYATVKTVLNQNAISGLIALALVIPLAAQTFDLSVGSAAGLCNVFVAWLLVNHGMAVVPALLLTVAAAVVIGLFNAFVVVRLRIDSFIATLATGSLMDALVDLLSNNQSISGNQLYGTFGKLSTVNIQGIDLPLGIMLVVSASLWFLQGYTVLGRRIYATGFNEPGSRLAGIRTQRIRFGSLVVSGFVAGIAGILLASEVSAGSPNIGPPYLLGAYAAAFLGATQFVRRFNAWGTVIAVMMLGTGTTGLSLIGANTWAQSLFTGAVLLCSLALTNVRGTFSLRERLNFGRSITTGDEARDVQSAPPSTTG